MTTYRASPACERGQPDPPPAQWHELRVQRTEAAPRRLVMVDLGDDHSLTADPTVAWLRAAAHLLDDDVWISVRLPGEYDGDDLDDGEAGSPAGPPS